MTITELFVIGMIASYRLTLLIHEEAGPWDIFGKLRDRIGIRYDERSNRVATNELAKMVLCPYCLSIWVAFGVFTFMWFLPSVQVVALPFAMSGGVVFLRKWTG
jgi:hypothetical protein